MYKLAREVVKHAEKYNRALYGNPGKDFCDLAGPQQRDVTTLVEAAEAYATAANVAGVSAIPSLLASESLAN